MNKYKFGDKKSLLLTSFIYLITAALSSFNFYMISDITNAALASDMDLLKRCAKILMVVVALSFFFNYIKTRCEKRYIEKSMMALRAGYSERLFELSVQNFSESKNDQLLSQMTHDMNRYEHGFYRNLLEILRSIFIVFTSMILLLMISKVLFLAGIILFTFTLYTSSKTSGPLKDQEKVKSKSLKNYTQYIKETLLGFYVIKLNNLEDTSKSEFIDYAGQIAEDTYVLDKKATKVDAINNSLQTALLISVLVFGMFLTKKLGIALGTILLIGSAFMEAMFPMQRIMPLISTLTSMESILLGFDDTLRIKKDNGYLELSEISSLKIKDANLGYDNVVLSDVNIEVLKNDKVLIVGGSGEGKSTILKSLRRQLRPLKGEVLVNDFNVEDLTSESYYRKFSIVDQIGFIFNGTLSENITLYKEADDTLENILKMVGLDDLSLDIELSNNGSNLSGGQRARLLLARSLYLNSDVIIADEIFASLNADVGSSIEYTMLHLNKTLISVSHIIFEENFNFYDKVYLVRDGSVSLIETYQELHDLDILTF